MTIRYAHTNLIARDWRALAAFYEQVFGCERLSGERDISGPELDRSTGLSKARLRGVHLRLPGCGEDGPTLEILQYDDQVAGPESVPNRPGFGHIAFAVDDVEAIAAEVFARGGSAVGEAVALEVEGAGSVSFQYLRDPEGNIIEVQTWD